MLLTFVIIGLILWIIYSPAEPSNENYSFKDSKRTFTSKFTRGGNLFYPEKLIFDDQNVTLINNKGIDSLYTTTLTQTIPIDKITGYFVTRFLVGCNITIVGDGYQNILAIGYDGDTTNEIEDILKKLLKK